MQSILAPLPVTIYWEDTDAGGIVYHANYLKYMERARTEILNRLQLSQEAIRKDANGLLFVVANADLKFHQPAVLCDHLRVHTTIRKVRYASIEFEQRIYRQDALITTGLIRIACVDAQTKRPTPMSEELMQLFTKISQEKQFS